MSMGMTLNLNLDALILVAVMTQPRDLEIARLFGWYRIPLRRAPKVIAVDYLAFYQTGSFREMKWRIQYIAPVKGHELTTRDALLLDQPDHPRAKEEYYKVQIGSLQELSPPILAGKWRRITFFYTTGEYMQNAESINDLIVHTEDRQILWKALRERLEKKQTYGIGEQPELELEDEVLAELLGFQGLAGQK
jgi:hypothetical protein